MNIDNNTEHTLGTSIYRFFFRVYSRERLKTLISLKLNKHSFLLTLDFINPREKYCTFRAFKKQEGKRNKIEFNDAPLLMIL